MLQSSKNCWRWVLASSLALPQNGLAYPIVIKPVLTSKFSPPILTSGPIGTLLVEGAEKSRRVFWAMQLEADGALMIGSDAESVRWGGTTRGRTLHKSNYGFYVKFCGRSKPVIHYPVFITTKEKTSQVILFGKWIFHFPFVHDLAYTINLCLPQQRRQKCLLVFRNV